MVFEKGSIPTTITLGGVTYSVSSTPELKELIQAVAKAEKDKLYSTAEELRKQIENLQNVQVVQQTVPEGTQPFSKEEVEETIRKIVSEVVQPLIANIQKQETNEIESFREQLLKDNEGICIPELVKGDSKEELLASLENSKRLLDKYSRKPEGKTVDPLIVEQAKTGLGVTTPTPTPAPQSFVPQSAEMVQQPTQQPQPFPSHSSPTPQFIQHPSPDVDPSNTASRIKSMTAEEFAKNREVLLQQLKQTYS